MDEGLNMGSAEVEGVGLNMDEARLAELQGELRKWIELLAWRNSSPACLKKIRDDVMVELYLAMKALEAVAKKKKRLQM